jgi:hypothetical protein
LEKDTLSETLRKILNIKNRCCQLFLLYNQAKARGPASFPTT